VIEVVCGVQFEELASFSTIHYSKFWSRVAGDYPRTEDREPLAEVMDSPQGVEARDQVFTLNLPPLRRVFFVSDSENYVLQMQPSRFLTNWRRRHAEDEYPRFTAAYGRFLRGWREFLDFSSAEKLGAPKVNQYELTYINHMTEAEMPFPEGIQEYVGWFTWRSAQTLKFLPSPRGVDLGLRFRLGDGKGTLHVTVKHGHRLDDKKGVMVMDLTARGAGKSDGSDMDSWFKLAHEWIVIGFTDLTTGDAHRRWERER
jgi:uncharacterized protein (TIGR04255 family)